MGLLVAGQLHRFRRFGQPSHAVEREEIRALLEPDLNDVW